MPRSKSGLYLGYFDFFPNQFPNWNLGYPQFRCISSLTVNQLKVSKQIWVGLGIFYFFSKSVSTLEFKKSQIHVHTIPNFKSAALGSEDFSGLASTGDLDKYADFIVSAISTAVDKAIPKSKSVRTESNPISEETLALIKEKRRLRRQRLSG